MRLLIWNTRGVGKSFFRSIFSRLIQQHGSDVCVLLETQLFGASFAHARRWISMAWSTYAVESKGLSGGILMMWRQGSIRMDAFHRYEQQVALVIFESTEGLWLLSEMYVSTEYKEWRELWSEIFRMVSLGLPSLVAGDFNCIMESHEKMGNRQYTDGIESREFRKFIDDAGLIDLGYSGPKFIWCNNQDGMARI
ncbi:uncharacterized protein [Elaeis guineensis]|uniref:uncharacterized protein n=1 Tax=Elaeis guineensis var. tenera TaxID=51953 RepID=UPI003C6D65A3